MQPLHIIKIGGKVLEDEVKLHRALGDFAAISGPKILVHGGGKKSDELCLQLGIEPKMHAGRRLTDAATMEVVTMVYAGLLNKTVVSRLQSFGCNAIGLTGADGNSILAVKRPVGLIDYGFAGDIESINQPLISGLLEDEITPVFCSITHDGKGQLLNTNADTITTLIAIALAPFYKVTLRFCFEKNGVLRVPSDDSSAMETINELQFKVLSAEGIINEGMIPKINNAFSARRGGVFRVYICSAAAIRETGGHKGTEICL